ncbi:MAG: acyltransferase [Acinetobacter sp.]
MHSLTLLRMFAAFGVFLSHMGVLSQSNIPQFNAISKYFFNGYIGVTFFYILSGFIITYSFSRHLTEGTFSNKDFIVYRFARLFPVHIVSLVCVLFLFGYMKNFEATNKEALISNVFLLQSFIPNSDYYFSFNPVSWSISCEMFFYLCFCLLVKIKTRYLCVILCSVLSLNVYVLINPPQDISLHWLFYINPVFRISDFIIGMLVCRAFLAKTFTLKVGVCSAMEVCSLIILAITIYIATNYISAMEFKYDLLYIPCMTLIVIAFAFDGGIVSRLLANKYLILLGEASFSFYMFHWMIVSKLIEVMEPNKNSVLPVLVYIATAFVVSVVVSLISYKLIEMPANRFIRNIWLNIRNIKNNRVA